MEFSIRAHNRIGAEHLSCSAPVASGEGLWYCRFALAGSVMASESATYRATGKAGLHKRALKGRVPLPVFFFVVYWPYCRTGFLREPT